MTVLGRQTVAWENTVAAAQDPAAARATAMIIRHDTAAVIKRFIHLYFHRSVQDPYFSVLI